MKHKLIAVALIAVLLCTVLGNSIACGPTTTQYNLIINSTAGGDVTIPIEGTHTYDAGENVTLVATADADYHFVNWTGNVGTIDDDEDATTTITMNGDYTITANFGFDMTFIDDVPDTSQPPTSGAPNYCAPIAMINVLCYWDVVKGLPNAKNVTAGLPAKTAADYLGWFMDTSNAGSSARANAGQPGTLDVDIAPGTVDFVRWDAAHLFLVPPPPAPALPAGKLGYDWMVTPNCAADYGSSLAFYKTEIDAGRPLVVSFTYWNPLDQHIAVTDPETEETINVFAWGTPTTYSTDPVENWDEGIGHAVTGVGYILNWDPDGAGVGLPPADYVIVYDNWLSTPKNIAIPWANWKCLFAVTP